MKKAGYIFILIGALGIISSALLQSLHIRYHNLFLISQIFFLAGIIQLPFDLMSRLKKYPLIHKIFLGILWVAILLVFVGVLLRKAHWDGSRNVLIAGYILALLYALFIITRLIADKLRTSPKGKPASPETLSSFGITSADLNQYVGVYDNKKLPLKITITKISDTLVARATGQSAYYLEVTGKNIFKYPKHDIVLEFDLAKNELILQQYGGYFPFVREISVHKVIESLSH